MAAIIYQAPTLGQQQQQQQANREQDLSEQQLLSTPPAAAPVSGTDAAAAASMARLACDMLALPARVACTALTFLHHMQRDLAGLPAHVRLLPPQPAIPACWPTRSSAHANLQFHTPTPSAICPAAPGCRLRFPGGQGRGGFSENQRHA